MARFKAPAKKQQKKGIDFKKIKRKLGRKLPPPKNATNTEIKSKAIILPEQSVAAEKNGLATSKKGLTLKELLQQTSHHNAKVRRDALYVIKGMFKSHPAELQSHKYASIEKLRERIRDDDKLVREAFYKLFKTQIFPGCKECAVLSTPSYYEVEEDDDPNQSSSSIQHLKIGKSYTTHHF